MSIFAVNMKHGPESCPMFNNAVRTEVKKTLNKGEDFAKKHGIKILSGVVSLLEHRIYYVMESDSQMELEEYLKEIGYASWNTIKIKQVHFIDDVLKNL